MLTRLLLLLLLLLGLPAALHAQSPFDSTIYGRNPKAGHYADIRGLRMYYETYGTGAPLLIIHGNGGSINNFLCQIPYFEKHYRVILADSRAQGKTADPGDSLSYEMMADDLAALLDKLQLDSCYVIGWSDGGINGLLLALRHPEKVKKLAITGANLQPDSSAVDPWVWRWAQQYQEGLRMQKESPEVRTGRKLARLLAEEPRIDPAALAGVRCPTLVIGGDHDVIRTEHTLLIARSIPRAYLWILPASGHSTPVVYHDLFNEVVDGFFRKPWRAIEREQRFQ
ncbi:alpha/beta hydrolase [Flaviaesturariibacter aridisoli]|uniref:Alpha/beta hydrolase n=2 Tax=Flaviaesturariibacter aridisoli TaxID=2545761 RepID=A0A4R4DYF1_9BACT|nr:alpha/beta hydrolase [Flaviaesturariibacter aridisoli]